jgi:hypothetical protein
MQSTSLEPKEHSRSLRKPLRTVISTTMKYLKEIICIHSYTPTSLSVVYVLFVEERSVITASTRREKNLKKT